MAITRYRHHEKLADVGEVAGDGGGGGHGRADQVGAAARALAALEVAVAGAGGSLAGLELVGVHGQAHAAPRLPPFGAGLQEDAVEPLGLGLVPDLLAAGHDQRPHARGRLAAWKTRAAARRSSIRPLVHEPMKTTSTGISLIGVPGSAPCIPVRGGRPRARRMGRPRAGHDAGDVDRHGRVGPPGHLRHQRSRRRS